MPRPDQAAAIPFRRDGGEVSICLITASSSRHWSIPKGFIDRGSSAEEAALQEAWEEAGLRGRIHGDTLGSYVYEKGGDRLTVAVFLMEVEDEADEWQEQEIRKRRWVPAADAVRILDHHPARHLVKDACARLAG